MSRWCLLFFILGLMTPALASALGVGEFVVASHLGAPLDATIDLELTAKESLDQVTARIASPELHVQLGLNYASFLSKIYIAKQTTDQGRARLQLRTAQPMGEVIVSFVLQVSYGDNHVLREYTAFLDPPAAPGPLPVHGQPTPSSVRAATVPQRQSAPVAATSAPGQAGAALTSHSEIPSTASRHARTAPVITTSTTRVVADVASVTAKRSKPARTGKSRPGKYGVVDGVETYGPTLISDSLGFVGRRFRPDKSVNLNQLMLALYRQNTDAFVGGNINRLKAGYYLQLKDPEDIESITKKEAARQVNAHNRAWSTGAPLSPPVVSTARHKQSAKSGTRKVSSGNKSKSSKPARVAVQSITSKNDHKVRVSPDRAVEMLGKQQVPGAEQAYMEDRVALMEHRLLELQEVYASKTLMVAQLETQLGQPAATPQAVPVSAIVPVPIVDAPARFAIPGSAPGNASADLTTTHPTDEDTVREREQGSDATVAVAVATQRQTPGKVSAPEFWSFKTIVLMAGFFVVLSGVCAAIWMRYRRPGSVTSPIFNNHAEIPVLDEIEEHASEALPDYHDAADFNPLDTMVAAKLSVMRGDSVHAIEMLKHSLVRDPRNEEYRIVLLETLYKTKNSTLFGLHANIYADIFGKDTPAWERIARMGRVVAPDLNIFGASEMDAYLEEPTPIDRFITDETTGEDEEDLDPEMFTSDALNLLEKAEASLGEVALEMNLPSGIAAGAVLPQPLADAAEPEEIVMGGTPADGESSAPLRSLDVVGDGDEFEALSQEFADVAVDTPTDSVTRKHATG